MNAKQIWQTAIERLRSKVQPAVFTTWFQGTAGLSISEGVFIVCVPTTFAKAHLEGRFMDLIREVLAEVTGSPIEVRFIVTKEIPGQGSDRAGETSAKRPYHVPKSRLAPLKREKQKLDISIAANSLAPSPARPVAHRSLEPDILVNGKEQGNVGASAEQVFEVISSEDVPETSRHMMHFNPSRSASIGRRAASSEGFNPSPLYSTQLLPLSGEGVLNPRYTFSAFIMGKSNQLAHAASLAVAENPGSVYNPLFFYGGVGLGKTHLLHAIGHVGISAGLNVLYVTSEKFTNEIINAIRFQKTEEFRAKYRQIDILLVDDIQFIAGKESTEEEFFHTFNTLHDSNKQIVITSDRPPKAIHSLQDRLRSRFEWGLLADILPPEYEHRLAILRSKAESLRFAIPTSVIEFIARPECNSVRELEGALNRVIAYATLHDAAITLNLAAQALGNIYTASKPLSHLTTSEILEGVCRYYNVDIERIRGKQREREIVWPRQVAMYLMREETDASLLQIGAELGGRDHTTIMHGLEKVQAEVSSNDRVRREIAAVLESLQQK